MGATEASACFHCGEAIPPGSLFRATVGGVMRAVCCAGCEAVARAIDTHGLAAYYATRSELPQPEGRDERPAEDFAAYDFPEVQKAFVRAGEGGMRQAALLVEGITCGACAWLIEQRLGRLDGVASVAVNLAARRAQIEWDDARVHLSAILGAIAELGYHTQAFDPVARESAARRERRTMLWRLFIAGLAMMQVMMYAVPVYLAAEDIPADVEQLMRWASLTLTVPVMLWSAVPFYAGAWRDLRARRAGMDTPVALGLAIAFGASAWATVSGRGEVYFDSIAMFVFLLLGARYLETLARARATESQQRLVRQTPAVAERLIPDATPPVTERVAAVQLERGDLVRVAPGSVVPADGVVTAGASSTDESLLTGEARAVAKHAGDPVIGGSVNLESPLTVRVTRVGPESVLAGITRLMDRAQAGKPAISQVADRVAHWFVLILLAVALATAAAWWWIDPPRALWVMVAVLVVSCPCALSLATPAALAAATGTLHRLGILVTRGHSLETLAQATHVVFDKTGTLTQARFALIGVIPLGSLDRESCIALATTLEQGSEHPVANALRSASCRTDAVVIDPVRNFPGQGIETTIAGRRTRIGSLQFASDLTRLPVPSELAFVPDDVTAIVLADENGYLALLTFGDRPRPGAHRLIRHLQACGKRVCLLSGDRRATVTATARALGIDSAVGDAKPEQKLAFVRDLQAQGGVVAMVGDGINDAPVLAQAQVSIAMGAGTDLAHASADMVLLADDMGRLGAAFDIARSTMRIIRQNLAWAAAYNACAIPLAAAGWVTPLAAGIGMAASSLLVVANALRLQAPGNPGESHFPGGFGGTAPAHGGKVTLTPP